MTVKKTGVVFKFEPDSESWCNVENHVFLNFYCKLKLFKDIVFICISSTFLYFIPSI